MELDPDLSWFLMQMQLGIQAFLAWHSPLDDQK